MFIQLMSHAKLLVRRLSQSLPAKQTLYDFRLKDIQGQSLDLGSPDLRDKVVLVVNVASKCGLTSNNYAQLKVLDEKYHDAGLRIVLFPCNQFAGQEPGDNATVCHYIQGISPRFIVTEKVDVNGSNTHPVFAWLKNACPGTLINMIKWNFTKVTIALCVYRSLINLRSF